MRPRDKPGMNSHVRSMFRKCHRYHKIAQRTGNPVDIENHRNARKIAKAAWRNARNEYVTKLFNSNNNPEVHQKNYWKLMKNVIGSKCINVPTLVCDDVHVVSDFAKCEILNDFFVDQTKLNYLNEPQLPTLCLKTKECLSDITVTEAEVCTILKSLNSSKANGPDNIGNLILKNNADSLSVPISFIINKSLAQGSFPNYWEQANVAPIFKKGDRQDYRNYRPISLLSCTSKVLERVVYNKLYDHCDANNLLSSRNSGFKRNDGAVNRLLYLVDRIHKGLDDEKEIAMVFLDICKAFDRVWHKGLLFKLELFGVAGNVLQWFRSYLENRCQKVVINGVSSILKRLFAGVPQGSILGPLLFLIHDQ